MTAQTPVYGIKYPVQGEPIRTTRQILQDNANAIEAALSSKALAPPGTADLTAALTRIGVLEQAVNAVPVRVPLNTAQWAHWPDRNPSTPQFEALHVVAVSNEVRLRGLVGLLSTGAITLGAGTFTIGTLQSQFRPLATALRHAWQDGANVGGRLDITPSGTIIWTCPGSFTGSSYLSIDVSWSLHNNV